MEDEGFAIQCRIIAELCKLKYPIDDGADRNAAIDSLRALRVIVKNEKFDVKSGYKKVEPEKSEQEEAQELRELKEELIQISNLEAQPRGFAFEKFLQKLFAHYKLAPRKSFRLKGEQIDGSFQLGYDTYLVEAKWQKEPTSQADLLVFREKVESKAAWARGFFISYSGFTPDGLEAFSKGRATNIIGMTGQDLYFILEGKLSLVNAITHKVRKAVETGEFLVSIQELSL